MGLLHFLKKKSKPVENKYVFDKAKFHDDSVEQLGLDEEQSFVHTGLFFAWLVTNGLMSQFFIDETEGEIEKLKQRKISPSTLYMNWDGVLLGEMLSDAGYNFALSYFDFEKGTYMSDYEKTFNVNGDQVFTVKDTWDNFDKIRLVIDVAYQNGVSKLELTCRR
jgi:hypothetical protein